MEHVGAWGASRLAQVLADHDDQTIQDALCLLVSERTALRESLIAILQERPAQRYYGVIKSFTPEKHFGFIQCDEIKAQFGGDVFLSDQELGQFSVGSSVSFCVALNKDGRPQAKLLQAGNQVPPPQSAWIEQEWGQPPRKSARTQPQSWDSWQPSPSLVPAVPVPPPAVVRMHAQAPAPMWHAQAPVDPTSKRWLGTVTKFFPDKRFGFIECEPLKEFYGADVFLSDQELGEFSIGSEVTFSVHLNKAGRPQADALQSPDAASAAAGNDGTDGRYAGIIKSFFPDKHFGFIQCDAVAETHGGDVFLSDQEIGSFTAGSAVSFSLAYNKSGKPQARALEAAL